MEVALSDTKKFIAFLLLSSALNKNHQQSPIHIHPVRPLYAVSAKLLGASMWFFLMYRAKKDGAVFLGLKHPWDH